MRSIILSCFSVLALISLVATGCSRNITSDTESLTSEEASLGEGTKALDEPQESEPKLGSRIRAVVFGAANRIAYNRYSGNNQSTIRSDHIASTEHIVEENTSTDYYRYDITAGDFDGDGIEELAVARRCVSGASGICIIIFEADDSTLFTYQTSFTSEDNDNMYLAAGNFDDDPREEIAYGYTRGGLWSIYILHWNPGGYVNVKYAAGDGGIMRGMAAGHFEDDSDGVLAATTADEIIYALKDTEKNRIKQLQIIFGYNPLSGEIIYNFSISEIYTVDWYHDIINLSGANTSGYFYNIAIIRRDGDPGPYWQNYWNGTMNYKTLIFNPRVGSEFDLETNSSDYTYYDVAGGDLDLDNGDDVLISRKCGANPPPQKDICLIKWDLVTWSSEILREDGYSEGISNITIIGATAATEVNMGVWDFSYWDNGEKWK
jgi:hypothetical protein